MIDSISALDKSFFLFLNSFHHHLLNPIMLVLSGQMIWIPFIGFFFWYCFKQNGRKGTLFFGLFLALTLVASDAFSSYILKNIFNRFRPCREIDLKPLIYSFGQKCGGKYGFVSSHAANSFALIWFSLSTLKFQKKLFYLFWLGPLLVSYSRIYLGVHYPGDILGGFIVGGIFAQIFSMFFKNTYGASR